MLKAEYHFYADNLLKKASAEPQIQTNYLRNRLYRAHLSLLKEAKTSPFMFEQSQDRLRKRYYFSSNNLWSIDWLNPMNSTLSKLNTNGILSSFHLVNSMYSKNALVNLLNLKVKIYRDQITDADIQSFLNNAGNEFFNPYTNKPMRWNAEKRTLVCDKPNSDENPIELSL